MARRRKVARRPDARSAKSSTRSAAPPELRVAKALFRKGEFQLSLRHFEACVRRYPTNLHVLIDAGRAFGHRYRVSRAEALLCKAQRLAPRRPEVHYQVGQSLRAFGRFRAAQRALERACQLVDLYPEAMFELAYLYERGHRLEEAKALLEQLRRSSRQHHGVAVLLARVLRRLGQATDAEAILQDVAVNASVSAQLRAEAWGELALLQDQIECYDSAWESILQCKRIQLKLDRAPWAAAQIVYRRFGQLVEQVTSDDFLAWRQLPAPSERLAVLTGFPRSGTTLLEQMLAAHPDLVNLEEHDVLATEIFPNLNSDASHDTPVNEILRSLPTDAILQHRSRYLHCMNELSGVELGNRWLLDKNPAVTLMIPVIRRLFPDGKLLFALRDPRDVIVSCFLRYLPLNPVSVCFLTLDRLVDRYRLDLEAWIKYRQICDEWLETRYEDLVESTDAEVKRVLDFLGLDWDDRIFEFQRRDNTVLSPTYEAVAKPVYRSSIGRWRNYQDQIEPHLGKLHQILVELGYS